MARTWYVGTGGSDLNSGSSDSNTADQSGASGVVVTATLTEVGAFAAAAATGAINLQDAGNSLIRTYTKVNDDSITLDSAPTSGDGTYAWKIGGRRTSIKKSCLTGTGNNAKIGTGDTVYVNAGTYTENAIAIAVRLSIIGLGGIAVIDGTGGAGGSDCLTPNVARGTYINIRCINAVDRGIDCAQYVSLIACGALTCGGIGIIAIGGDAGQPAGITTYNYCYSRSNTGAGWQAFDQSVSNGAAKLAFCESGDNGGAGFAAAGNFRLYNFLCYDNALDGINSTPATSNGQVHMANCTIEGNGGDGLDLTVTNMIEGSTFVNNIFSNNGAYGVNCNAQIPAGSFADYNVFFGNSTNPRNNFITGTNDKTTDPAYTAAASDDYSIKSTGGAYKAGYSPFKNPTLNTLNIGAVPGIGSGETVGGGSAGGGTSVTGVFPGAWGPR